MHMLCSDIFQKHELRSLEVHIYYVSCCAMSCMAGCKSDSILGRTEWCLNHEITGILLSPAHVNKRARPTSITGTYASRLTALRFAKTCFARELKTAA